MASLDANIHAVQPRSAQLNSNLTPITSRFRLVIGRSRRGPDGLAAYLQALEVAIFLVKSASSPSNICVGS
jgi:hypothetical protein